MVTRLKEVEEYRAHFVSFVLGSDEIIRLDKGNVHLLDLLSETGRYDKERRIALNGISVALFADMLHFIFEGLRALEKRKFTVAFTVHDKIMRGNVAEGALWAMRALSKAGSGSAQTALPCLPH